jgi:hypothetical protein
VLAVLAEPASLVLVVLAAGAAVVGADACGVDAQAVASSPRATAPASARAVRLNSRPDGRCRR